MKFKDYVISTLLFFSLLILFSLFIFPPTIQGKIVSVNEETGEQIRMESFNYAFLLSILIPFIAVLIYISSLGDEVERIKDLSVYETLNYVSNRFLVDLDLFPLHQVHQKDFDIEPMGKGVKFVRFYPKGKNGDYYSFFIYTLYNMSEHKFVPIPTKVGDKHYLCEIDDPIMGYRVNNPMVKNVDMLKEAYLMEKTGYVSPIMPPKKIIRQIKNRAQDEIVENLGD